MIEDNPEVHPYQINNNHKCLLFIIQLLMIEDNPEVHPYQINNNHNSVYYL